MNDVWIELWTRPGHDDFGIVVEDPDAASWSATERMGLGEGAMHVPAMWEYLDDALWDDPADPANNVRTIARVYNEARPEIPVAEFFLDDLTPNEEDGQLWDIVGLGIAKIFGYMIVEPPDWAGQTNYETAVPDWVYGGRNALGELSARFTPERIRLDLLRVDDGTFTITVTNDDGSETTDPINWDALAVDVDAELTALSNVTFVSVDGQPGAWRLTFNDPSSEYIVSANSSGLVGQWRLDVDATGGTFTVTIDGNTSGNIDWNVSAANLKTAIEAITGVTTVEVTKDVSTDPNHGWVIEFVVPESATTFTANGASLTGGAGTAVPLQLDPLAQVTLTEQGKLEASGWEIARSYLSEVDHGTVIEFRMWETGDPALPAGCTSAMMFNGLEPDFPGIQKVISVTPGALYQVHAWVTAGNAGDTVRMVVRTLAELELQTESGADARDEQSIAVAGTWQEFEIVDLRIPDDVNEVIVRFGHTDEPGVDPGRIFIACPTMRLGFRPETWGGILEDLYIAATTGVPSRTAAGFGLWWDERDPTGVDRYLELDFDATNDSAGVPWIREEEMTIKRGLNGIQVLDEGSELGYEHRVIPKQLKTADPADDGVWLLQAFNPGGMDDGHPADDEFLLTEAVRLGIQFYAPRGTRVISEGNQNRSSRAISAAAEASMGAIEVYLNQRDLESGDTLAAAAAAGLDDAIRRTRSINPVIQPLPDEHQPLIDWMHPGNTEDLEFPPFIGRESVRVREVTLAVEGDVAEYQLSMGSESAPSGFSAVSKAVNYLLNKPDVIRDSGDGCCDPFTIPPLASYYTQPGTPGSLTPQSRTYSHNGTLTTHDWPVPTGVQRGDHIYFGIMLRQGGASPEIATMPNNYETLVDADALPNTAKHYYIFYKVADGTEADTTFTTTVGTAVALVSWRLAANGGTLGIPEVAGPATLLNPDPISPTTAPGLHAVFPVFMPNGGQPSPDLAGAAPTNYESVNFAQSEATLRRPKVYVAQGAFDIATSEDPGSINWSDPGTGNFRLFRLWTVATRLAAAGGSGLAEADHVHTEDEVSEIDTLTEKGTPIAADRIKVYDSEDSDNPKWAEIGNLPAGGSSGWVNWTPQLFAGANMPTQAVNFAKYKVDGGMVFFKFHIDITGTVSSGTISIRNIPADLQTTVLGTVVQDAMGLYHDTGTAIRDGRWYPSSATEWRFRQDQATADFSVSPANGDDVIGSGFFII